MIFDASRTRTQGPRTRARLAVFGMRRASAWRLAGLRAPARRLAVRRAGGLLPRSSHALHTTPCLGRYPRPSRDAAGVEAALMNVGHDRGGSSALKQPA
jgi:hypothetical protein